MLWNSSSEDSYESWWQMVDGRDRGGNQMCIRFNRGGEKLHRAMCSALCTVHCAMCHVYGTLPCALCCVHSTVPCFICAALCHVSPAQKNKLGSKIVIVLVLRSPEHLEFSPIVWHTSKMTPSIALQFLGLCRASYHVSCVRHLAMCTQTWYLSQIYLWRSFAIVDCQSQTPAH